MRLEKQVHILQLYTGALTIAFVALLFAGFQDHKRSSKKSTWSA